MRAKPVQCLLLLTLGLCTIALSGCAGNGAITGALEAAGLRRPAEVPDLHKAPRTISIRLHASGKLNVDAQGRTLALVTRIYKLRQSAAFEQAPYDTFLSAQKEKDAFGADLLEVKEVILVPGQRYEVLEKVSREAYFVGVVALFHAPAAQRWRLAFSAAEAEKTGMTIGAHACALTVGGSSAQVARYATMRSPAHCQ